MADVQDDPALRPLDAYANPDAAPQRTSALSPPTPSVQDDPALRPLEAFNPNAGVTPYTPTPTWHPYDIGHGLAAGFHGGLAAPLAEVTGQTEEAEAERQSAEASRAAMTPGAEETWPVWGAEQVAPTAAMLAPLAIPGAGFGLSIAAGAAISGGSAISENKEAINNANDVDLMDKNPTYRDYRQSGMTEVQAKAQLGQDAALSVGVPGAIIGGALSAVGGVELTGLAKIGVGEAENAALTGGNFLTRRVTGRGANAVVGAGRGMVEMGPLGAVQTAVTGHEQAKEGIGEEATPEELLSAGVGQGLFGAVTGVGGGLIHGGVKGGGRNQAKTQTGGESTIGRETPQQRQSARKPETQAASPTEVQTPSENKEPAQPTAVNKGVGPAETAALNPEPVTPRVIPPEVVPTENVQPTVEPSTIGKEAPPAAEPPSEPSPPPPPVEAAPAPIPAPPSEDVAAITPESDAARAEQFAALTDKTNPRDAMVYDLGVQPFDLPNKKAYGQTTLDDGRTVQFYKYGPNKLINADKVKFYDQQGRLNDLTGLGPVTKDEALSRVAAGETPAAVTERTKDGTEVKAAAGTTETAPAQVADLEANKTPGNVVSVERPEDVVAARQAGVEQEQVAPRETVQLPVVSPEKEVTPLGKATGRVLEATDEASIRARDAAAAQDALQAQTVQDQLKAKAAAKQAAADAEAGVKARSHTGKVDQAKIANDNIGARRIVEKYPAPEATDNVKRPTQIYDRAKEMVKEAKAAGIKIPDAFPEGHPYNDAMLKLREAADLTSKASPKWDAYGRFLDREHLIDTGRGREAFEARRNEGALGLGSPEGAEAGVRARGGAVDEEGRAEERAGAVHEETPVEHMAAGGGEEAGEEHPPAGPTQKELDAQRMAERRAESAAMREEAAKAPPKAAVGFQTAVKKSRRLKSEEIDYSDPNLWEKLGAGESFEDQFNRVMGEKEEPVPEGAVRTLDAQDRPTHVVPSKTLDAREAVVQRFDIKRYPKVFRPLMQALVNHLMKVAGDTDVHFISGADMERLTGKTTIAGYYDHDLDHIMINSDRPRPDTVLHEVFHAATAKGIDASPALRNAINKLLGEVAAQLPDARSVSDDTRNAINYAIGHDDERRSAHEFLTVMMTNHDMLNVVKKMRISDQLAKELNLPKWRKATVFNGFIQSVLDHLGLSSQHFSAVEAALSLGEQATWARAPGEGMGFMGRLDKIEREERAAKGWPPMAKITPEGKPRRSFQDMEPEEAIQARADDAQEAAVKPPGFWNSEQAQAAKTGMGQKFFNAKVKASATDALRIDNEHMFGEKTEANPMRRVQEGLLKQEKMIQNALKGHDDLMQRMMNMKRTNPDGLDRMVTLLSESHDYNVHPDEALGVGRNEYIKPNKKGEFGVDSNTEHHEAILAHERLSDDFNRSTEDERALFSDIRDALMEEGHKSVKAGIETFSNGLRENFDKNEALQEALKTAEANRTPSEIKQVERYNAVTKVLDGDKLEGDEAEKFNADPHIKMLRDLRGMLKQEGPHFPGQRDGDWVVNGEHELPKAPNAVSIKGDEVTFANKQDAYDYRQGLVDKSLPSTMEKVTEPTSTAQKPGQGEQYKVTVQTKHSSAVNSVHEGKKLGDALRQMGLKNVTEPMLREKNVGIDYGLHSGTIRAMDHAIDALTHLGNDEKAALKEANQQASLGLMKGNRVNRGLLKSNRVRGANADPVLAVHNYLANSARSQARSKTMPDIDKAFGEMRDTARNVQDENTPKRGVLVREMEDRALHFGKEGFTGQMSPMLQRITTLAYVKDMMAPIHYALDLTHPYLYSIPQLAGRHGYGQAHSTYLKSLSDMGAGGTLGKGIKGMFGAIKSGAHAPTDLMSGIRDSIAKSGTANDLKAFDSGMDTPHLGSILTDYRKSFDRTGMVDRGTQYLQNIGNEMSHAVDAVNRVATYMSAYRLERAKMGKPETLAQDVAQHAQAVRYAKDTVSQTLGIYSASNRASFMKNPYVRAAMQFRSVPMMIYRLLAKNVYNAVRGETPEVKRAAVISLVSTMGASATLVGAASGVPEPIRLAVELSHALGLTRSWEEYEDAARKATTNSLGKFGGHLVMDGILGAAGLSAGSRIGLSDLMVKDQALQSPKDFLFDMVGSGTGYVKDEWDGVNSLLKGDYKHGIPGVIPIRLFSDIAKAYAENESGVKGAHGQPDMTPLDPYETFIRAAGGTPTREALYRKETGLIKEEHTEQKDAIAAAAQGDKIAASRWNLAHPQNRITAGHILRQRQANRLNKPLTPKQRATQEEYNVYQ